MKKTLIAKAMVVGLAALLAAAGQGHGMEIGVDVAPRIINVDGKAPSFVVHTDLAYGLVDPATVVLNGVPISRWKMDSLGNFDAIVRLGDIVAELEPGRHNLFLLEGMTRTEPPEPFWGAEEVLVVEQRDGSGPRR